MESTTKDSPITQKTLELCQAIVAQPDFQALRGKLDAFMRDEVVKFQFQQINELNEILQIGSRAAWRSRRRRSRSLKCSAKT